MSEGGDDNDLFGEALGVEEASIQQGKEDGVRDGMLAGMAEGRELGVQKGYEIGQEVGFYAGCVRMWRGIQAREPELLTARLERGLASLEDMIQGFPLYDPQDESLHEALERLRGRFKVVASGLGCLQDYFPKGGSAEATLSF
ncbi:hypothetical protein VOLCADRAFT_109638 [Volvox carteri f. nagariensis]|uniref:Essential protein Yae1 N-terminal domain-containing protein n=1 Tax=Volvox carteri f. nagariensis TaxID=3068 RepID=D8TN08_VOLCA|nr:uncharacterized protein VOLCADRAFT_109638 [Volvox carteri f. nagariensis]EFJ51219.1 hypothetical protein VOLCADRAFT_109638 [Volvox carteri f. nagariensis]|eukprot:XP_002947686.1 hypothetical protein VOLCADRAFT_109638 [Volvox carteri f. nagariensis]